MTLTTFLPALIAISLLLTIPVSASELVSFEPECQPHIIHRFEGVSRDYTYLEFSRSAAPCQLHGRVGGEHQTFIEVLGFTDERYSISFINKMDNPSFSISGDGINVSNSLQKNVKIVEIEALHSIFSIAISAYPYGKYQMIIKRL